MPHYIASGSHVYGDMKYRFLVLPRYESDLQKISANLPFFRIQPRNVLILAAQIIDVLEYLHQQGYAHSDIKSSNLMVGFDKSALKNNTQKKVGSLKDKQSTLLPNPKAKAMKSKCNIKDTKTQGYYADEDFEVDGFSSGESEIDSSNYNKRLLRIPKNGTSKKTKIKSNIDRGRGIFNLRKVNQSINYEDISSSICSDGSYQSMLNGSIKEKLATYSSDEGFHEDSSYKKYSENNVDSLDDDYEEAVMSQNSGQIYLLDYGLASKFLNSDGSHKEFGMDLRKAHDGTLEYSSRDSHIGAHSRRSDLENLGYNILDWLTGGLPWKTAEMLADPDLLHAVKKNYMSDVRKLLEACFKSPLYPKFLEKYFLYITGLDFKDEPDYKYCKSLFVNEFVKCGFGTEKDMVLNFKNDLLTPKKKLNFSKQIKKTMKCSPNHLKRCGKTKFIGVENLVTNSWESFLKLDLLKEVLNSSNDGVRKPCTSRNFYVSDAALITKLRQSLLPNIETPSKKFSPKVLRSKKILKKKKKGSKNNKSSIGKFGNFLGSGKQYTWAEILAGNPESLMRKIDKSSNAETPNESVFWKKPRSRKVSNASEVSANVDINASPNLLNKDFLNKLNPTYAMKEVVANYKKKTQNKQSSKAEICENAVFNDLKYTPAMLKVLAMKEKRVKKERALEAKELAKAKKNNNLKNRKVSSNKQANNAVISPIKLPVSIKKTKCIATPKAVKQSNKKSEKVIVETDNDMKSNKVKKATKVLPIKEMVVNKTKTGSKINFIFISSC